MACGTPVIAYPRGSMVELIKHGASGFLASSEEEAVTAVERLGSLDRMAIRTHAGSFSDARMVDAYLAAYQAMLLGERGPAASGMSNSRRPRLST